MAYAGRATRRYGSYRRKTYRTPRSSRYARTRPRYGVRKRVYRRKTAGMSKRRLLNITSKKKRDTMPFFNPDAPTATALSITADATDNTVVSQYIFSPTAREYISSTDPADRSSSTVFWRGFKERLTINANTSAPWRWRRIIFSTKSLRIPTAYKQTSGGYRRVMLAWNDPASIGVLFKGKYTVDYSTIMEAFVDPNRAKIISDKTRILRTGSSGSHFHEFKSWTPFNKTMYYDEDENGADVDSSPWANTGAKGMGDVFVYDMFQCTVAGTTNKLDVSPAATVYWHER